MKIYIGCSGYHYSDWKNRFYPAELKKNEWLSFYSEQFNTVEINNTFYKMPQEKDLERWKETIPDDFKFTLKANRYFTHQKKLNIDDDFRERLRNFIDLARGMDSYLGCILWQLPGNLHKNTDKLKQWCDTIDKRTRHVIEFRHTSWFDDEVYKTLADFKIGFCMLSAPDDLPEEIRITSNFGYLRLHGKKEWYDYFYSEEELKNWSSQLRKPDKMDELFVYFNNDKNANAPENAKMLKRLMK